MGVMIGAYLIFFGILWSVIVGGIYYFLTGSGVAEYFPTLLLFIGPICFVVGLVLFVTGKLSKRDFEAHAETAPATILKVWQTGMVLNDVNPQIGLQLNVQPANRPAFQAEAKMFVQMIQIPQLQPGVAVQVKYDARNPSKIEVESVGGDGATTAANVAQMEQTLLAQDKLYEAIRSMGQPAQAVILNVTDMGIQVGDTATLKKFQLEVQPADRPSFHAETQGAISVVANDKYQPGKTVWVKFNPNDLTQVSLDHS